jgi:hypothetical protein
MIALRLRSTNQGDPDLRGEHPIVLEANDAAATERVRDWATRIGIAYTSGTHPDGSWTDFSPRSWCSSPRWSRSSHLPA